MSIPPYTPATDLLGHTAPLEHALSLPLLGVPCVIRSNSPAVIAVARAALGRWQALDPALVEGGPPLRVDIVVHPEDGAGHPSEAPEGRSAPRPPGSTDAAEGPAVGAVSAADFSFRAHGDVFVAGAGANLLCAQMAHGQALAFVTPALAADAQNLRAGVIECLALLLTTYRDRTPIHAGAVARGGRAVLLAGASAAGKSTLCYACVRRGFQLLAEDVVQVSLSRGLRIWGNPQHIHLLPDAPRFFPELGDLPPLVRFNGKRKLVVDLAERAPDRLITHADSAVVCLLARGEGQASRIAPIDPAEAVAALADAREPGFNLLRERAPAAAAALARGGAYRLTVGADPLTAVGLIEHLTSEG